MFVPMKYLVVLSILISGSFGFANPCEDTRQLKSLWETKYIKLVQNPEALGSGFDASSMAYKLAQAICILEFPGLPNYDGTFYTYFEASAHNIFIELNNPFEDNNAIASTPQPGIVLLHPNFFSDRPEMIFIRSSTLVHEARHSELTHLGIPNHHVVCLRGIYKNKESLCDKEFGRNWKTASVRSYQVMFLNRLYETSSFYRNNALLRMFINDLINNYFNQVDQETYNKYYK